ncbi:MAG: hypothetical protein QW620_04775 [Thermoplasmata archaeon]
MNAYPIDGGAGASDWYPLGGPVCECSGLFSVALFVISIIGCCGFRRRILTKL